MLLSSKKAGKYIKQILLPTRGSQHSLKENINVNICEQPELVLSSFGNTGKAYLSHLTLQFLSFNTEIRELNQMIGLICSSWLPLPPTNLTFFALEPYHSFHKDWKTIHLHYDPLIHKDVSPFELFICF